MSVSQILIDLGSADNVTRSQAERVVESEKENNFANFCMALLFELQDESRPSQSRQQAGLLLKNSVALDVRNAEAKELLDKRWKSLGPEIRGSVKQAAMATLNCPETHVRGIAAVIIANLARIELPYNEWPTLITDLVAGCDSGIGQMIEASLTTLGYICEEAFLHEDVAQKIEGSSEQILHAICTGMARPEDTIVFAATKALVNSLEFIGQHMENEQVASYLINTVCTTVSPATQREDTREQAMRCLVKIADLYYSLLPNFINGIYDVTARAVHGDSESVVLQAMLFWIALCENEMELLDTREGTQKCQYYAKRHVQPLLDLCLACMVRQDEYQTEEDWNISSAGSKLLFTLARTVGDDIVSPTMTFVYSNVNAGEWRKKEAALMAFGCIMTGPDPGALANTVAQAVSILIDEVQSPHPLVADTAGWLTSVVCENFPNIFLEVPQNMQQLVAVIGPMLNGPNTAMCIRAANIIHNIALHFEDEDEEGGMPTNCLSPYFQPIAEALLARIDRDDAQGKARKVAVEALNAMIDASANDVLSLVDELILPMMTRVQAQGQQFATTQNSDVLLLQGLLCGSLSAIIKKLGGRIAPHADNIMNLLSGIFSQQADTVLEEGMLLMGTLAAAVGHQFQGYLAAVMPMIMRCATMTEQEDLCTAAVGVIGDIAGAVGPGLSVVIDAIVNTLGGALLNEEVDRDMKIEYIGCLGDVALHSSEAFQPYVANVMGAAQQLFAASTTLDFSNDYDLEEYVMDLWEGLCNMSSSIAQGVREHPQALLPYVQPMCALADHVCRNSLHVSDDTFGAAITLIGDLANITAEMAPALRQQAAPIVLDNRMKQCVEQGVSSKEAAVNKKSIWARRQMADLSRAR